MQPKLWARRGFHTEIVKTSIDKPRVRSVFRLLFRKALVARTSLPGSSVAEQVTVNHLVAGSIPARAAISFKEMRKFMRFLKNQLGHFLATFRVPRLRCRDQIMDIFGIWRRHDFRASVRASVSLYLGRSLCFSPSCIVYGIS